MTYDCLQVEEGFIPCLQHQEGAWASCKLVFCMDCGRDLYRECEREVA